MSAGIDLDRDAWLSEGLAQYASVGYFERTYGATDPNLLFVTGNGVLEDFVAKQFGYLNLREHMVELPYIRDVWSGFDEALVKPLADLHYANANAVRLYDKGFVVARALAAAVGSDAFDRVLERALDGERGGTTRTGDAAAPGRGRDGQVVRSVVRRVGLRRRVGRLLRHGRLPRADRVDVRDAGPRAPRRRRRAGRRGRSASRVRRHDATDVGRGGTRRPCSSSARRRPVSRVTVDPDHRLPDRDRINNNAPVRIVVAADKAAMPLDAYVLAPDTGSSGVSFSYLDRFRVGISQDHASLVVRRGRGEVIQADLSIADGTLEGSVGYSLTTYAEVETGAPGTTWEPDFAYSISGSATRLGRVASLRVAALRGRPLHDGRLDRRRRRPGSRVDGRRSPRGGSERRVRHPSRRSTSRPRASSGTGSASLPTALRFSFSELHATSLAPADVKALRLVRARDAVLRQAALQPAEPGHDRRTPHAALRRGRDRLDKARWIRYNVGRRGGRYGAGFRPVHPGRVPAVHGSPGNRSSAPGQAHSPSCTWASPCSGAWRIRP